MGHADLAAEELARQAPLSGPPCLKCGCSSVVEHLLAKERVESSNLFIRLFPGFPGGRAPAIAARARR